MKRTQLQRKTPLKSKTPLKAKSWGIGKSSISKGSKKNLTNKPASDQKKLLPVITGNRHGLQGKGRTELQAAHHSKIVQLGCFACNYLNVEPRYRLCVHHTDGRANGKINDISEWLTICLCEFHHDPSVCPGETTKGLSVHHNKKMFIKLIGTEFWCVLETFKLLNESPPWMADDLWKEYLELNCKTEQEGWIIENPSAFISAL